MNRQWKNSLGENAIELLVDNVTGISLKLNNEEKVKHGKEVEELQTLDMYPPKNEEKVGGELSEDGKWTTYEFKPGKNWNFAKKDIEATCDFWMSNANNAQFGGQVVMD